MPHLLDLEACRRRMSSSASSAGAKNWRHIPVRYDRFANNYLAAVTLALGITQWIDGVLILGRLDSRQITFGPFMIGIDSQGRRKELAGLLKSLLL